jgi:hypothetical protein
VPCRAIVSALAFGARVISSPALLEGAGRSKRDFLSVISFR